jgi:uncharacterized membrane protein YbaN (DUF454 family)
MGKWGAGDICLYTPQIVMKITKLLLIIAGFLFLTLAAAGIMLPVLPATPFLLAASFCFMKSSRRLHGWFMANRFFGPRLRRIQSGAGLTAREKITIYLIACACIIPVIILTKSPHLRIFLVFLLAIKAVVFLMIKTAKNIEKKA